MSQEPEAAMSGQATELSSQSQAVQELAGSPRRDPRLGMCG